MDRNDDGGIQKTRDFERLSTGGSDGSTQSLHDVVARWGPEAVADGARILSTWDLARSPSIPLWFPALVRSRQLVAHVIELGVPLGGPAANPAMQAWRYAAFNGWAQEAADLFAVQASSAPIPAQWNALWSAISEGCLAQEQGWGSKAASWLGSISGGKIGASEMKIIGLMGKAFDKGVPKSVSQPAEDKARGWDVLCKFAIAHWGPCPAKDSEAAMSGHPAAKDLALTYCVPDSAWAQSQLAAMIVGFKEETLGSSAEFEAAMSAQKPIGAQGAETGWAEVKSKAQGWASSAAKLVAMGAAWPQEALSDACLASDWNKAYALALAGASLREGCSALWILSRSRRGDPMRKALGQMTMASQGIISLDEQSLDVAKALAGVGAKASEKGADGKDALEELYEPDGSSVASLGAELIGLLVGSMGGAGAPAKPTPKKTPKEEVESRGLAPYADYLTSLIEREQIQAVSASGSGQGEGPSRL